MTTALYRRYRPESFAEVIGQEHVTGPLMQALRTGRINHAYLFSGPRGCGKTTSARILARCLNCEQGPTPTPCGVCESCVALARGGPGTVDVIEIDAASHGGVDDARDLRERASYGPAQSRFKIYIIDEAHMVTPQGFNALLKIVEEPPEHVKFVFATTEPEKVIGTIRSRTHHYPFRLVPPAQLSDYLQHLCDEEGVTVAPGVLGFVVRAGGGSVRDSLSVLDQLIAGSGEEGLTYDGAAALLGFTDGELLDATIEAFAAGDGASVFTQVDRVVESGHDPRRFVEDLLERLRDLIVVAAVPDGAGAVLRGLPEDQLDRMRSQAARFGGAALTRAADIVNTGLTEMTGATAPRLQLELICARILLPAASGEQGYGARLDRLERRIELGGGPAAGSSGSGGRRPALGPAADPAPAPAPPPPDRPARSSRSDPSPPTSRRRPGGSRTGAGPGPGPAARPATRPGRARPRHGATAAAGPRVDERPGRGRPAPVPAASTSPGPSARRSRRPAAPPGGLDVAADPPGVARRAGPDLPDEPGDLDLRVAERAGAGLRRPASRARHHDPGLANTFRSGRHPEVVRQALIDEIGLDVKVEGVPSTGMRRPRRPPTTAPHPAVPRTRRSRTRTVPDPAPRPAGGAERLPPRGPQDTAPPGRAVRAARGPGRPARTGRGPRSPRRTGGRPRPGRPRTGLPARRPRPRSSRQRHRPLRPSRPPSPQPPSAAPVPRRATDAPASPPPAPTGPPARAADVRRSWPGPVSRPSSARAAGREGGSGPAEPAPPRADEEASPDDEDFAPSGASGGGRRARPRRQGARRVRGPLRFEDPSGPRRPVAPGHAGSRQRCRGNIPRVRLP